VGFGDVNHLASSRDKAHGRGLETKSQKPKVFGTTWSARSSDLNATENVCLAIKLKLHIERDVINMQAELVNAACGIRRAPFIECIQNLYAYITHQFCGDASAVKEPCRGQKILLSSPECTLSSKKLTTFFSCRHIAKSTINELFL